MWKNMGLIEYHFTGNDFFSKSFPLSTLKLGSSFFNEKEKM